MGFTDHYVTDSGADTWANSTNPATPCSWATMIAAMTGGAAAPGDRIWIKKGTYSRTTSTDNPQNDGTAATPILILGYDQTPGDLDPPTYNADGTLVTTNYPVITYTSGRLNASTAVYVIWRNLKIVSAASNATISTGSNNVLNQCRLENSSSNGNAMAASSGGNGVWEDNDFAATALSGGYCAAQPSVQDVIVGKPFSRNAQFNQKALIRLLKDRYVHVPELGNLNYKGGPVKLQDPAEGVRRVTQLLESGKDVMLMCVCDDVMRCHRTDAMKLIASAVKGLKVNEILPTQRF